MYNRFSKTYEKMVYSTKFIRTLMALSSIITDNPLWFMIDIMTKNTIYMGKGRLLIPFRVTILPELKREFTKQVISERSILSELTLATLYFPLLLTTNIERDVLIDQLVSSMERIFNLHRERLTARIKLVFSDERLAKYIA